MPRLINTAELVPLVADLIIDACCNINDDNVTALKESLNKEESPYGKDALAMIIENICVAKKEKIAVCQDTGSCVIFMEIGQEVSWQGEGLVAAINEGVRRGYTAGFLRKSIVRDPLDRINTGDNTPAVLHTEITGGSEVKITVLPKGGGSENMGAFTTLSPSAGKEGIQDFVLKTMLCAGGKPCPPVILGIGLGGTMDYCAFLAKKALIRPLAERNKNPFYAEFEQTLLDALNNLGIGPLGMGGRISALAVHIEQYPCHITALPVALCFQCHAARYKSIVI
ncbi:MAG: fumarate hydratase [Spirochaetaceae bacterium]|jgi:fumarate hydratase subunit alpha|nr:fumarate hydratase [Spirochaetaceae bacterium]